MKQVDLACSGRVFSKLRRESQVGGWRTRGLGRKEKIRVKGPTCMKVPRWREVEFSMLEKHEQTSVARAWGGEDRAERGARRCRCPFPQDPKSHSKSLVNEVPKESTQNPLDGEQASTGCKGSVALARNSKVRRPC